MLVADVAQSTRLREEEIRPAELFNEYLRLAAIDVSTYFSESDRSPVPCPACGATGEVAFAKQGFVYEECPDCETLFVSPRPPAEAFSRYYTEAPSVEFWATDFYRATAESRREKLWRPKAQRVVDAITRHGDEHHSVVDIGGGYGIFAEEIAAIWNHSVTIIEPGPALAEQCRSRGLQVVQAFLADVVDGDLPPGPRTFTSFELFEHLHDPLAFLNDVASLMASGDLLLMTTLSSHGIDIRSLWDKSKSVSPPHHVNFFNPVSLRLVLESAGLEVLEVNTPGRLDIDIMEGQVEDVDSRFLRSFLRSASPEDKAEMQRLLASSGWSSHIEVIARRP
jgi:hypothetical protein